MLLFQVNRGFSFVYFWIVDKRIVSAPPYGAMHIPEPQRDIYIGKFKGPKTDVLYIVIDRASNQRLRHRSKEN
jgi:hypothetical protein